jgi:glycosyltransferase involved in cell wall biosynthesis
MNRPPRTIQIQLNAAPDAPGGGSRHARNLARGLRELGVRVTVLCTGRPIDRIPDEFAAAHWCRPRSGPLLWRLGPLATLQTWLRAARRATADVDAVIALSPAPAVATSWVRPRLPLIYAPAVLDRVEHPSPRQTLYQRLERHALHRADAVLVRTAAVREAIANLYGRRRGPFGIALPGIDPRHAAAATRPRAALGIPDHARLLVTVGLVNENKGQQLIARALLESTGPDWWWAIIGTGPDATTIRAMVAGTPLAPRTLLVGHDTRVADWYAAADVLVAASRHETFGQVVAEALAAGLPVIIPRNEPGATLSPLAEHVERHELGRTFRRGDTTELAAALHAVLDSATEHARLCRHALRFARANFVWTRYAECALQLLSSGTDVVFPALSGCDDLPAPTATAARAVVATPTAAASPSTCA